jgi:hypothetical protein
MSGFLQDGKGANSSTRLVMMIWSIAILAVWVGFSVYKGEMLDIPQGVQWVLGIVLGGKVAQSFAESKS